MKENSAMRGNQKVEQIQSITFNSKSKESSNVHKNFSKHQSMKTLNSINESLKIQIGETQNREEPSQFIQHKSEELAYLQSLSPFQQKSAHNSYDSSKHKWRFG